MTKLGFSCLTAAVRAVASVFLILLMLAATAAGAGTTLWQKDNDFVRLENAEGVAPGTPSSSLPPLSKDAVRAVLTAIKLSNQGHEMAFLTDDQAAAIADPVAQGLRMAGPGQDVVFAIHYSGSIMSLVGAPKTCAGRIFVDGDSIGVIVGMVQESFLSTVLTVDPAKIRTGSRAAQQQTEFQVIAGGAVSLPQNGRSDWARISPSAWTGTYGMPIAAAPAPMPKAPAAAPPPPVAAADSAAGAAIAAPVPHDPLQIEQRFATLKRLLDNHMITDQEYQRAKDDLLKAVSQLPAQ